MKKVLRSTSLRFLVVGVANTLFGLLVIYGAKLFAGLGDVAANVIGYSAGLGLSFLLNSRWTFRFDGLQGKAALRYLVAFVLAYSLNLVTVLGCIRLLSVDGYAAQAAGVFPYTVAFYALSKWYVFDRPAEADRPQLQQARDA